MGKHAQAATVFAGTVVQADVVRAMLESAGIASRLINEHMGTVFPWQFAPGGAGAVQVLVAAEDADEALEIVRSFSP